MHFKDPSFVLTLVALLGIVMSIIGHSRKENFIVWWIAGASIFSSFSFAIYSGIKNNKLKPPHNK